MQIYAVEVERQLLPQDASCWIAHQGRQRIACATEMLEAQRAPRSVLHTLTGWQWAE
jgi:hypothetical protein